MSDPVTITLSAPAWLVAPLLAVAAVNVLVYAVRAFVRWLAARKQADLTRLTAVVARRMGQ